MSIDEDLDGARRREERVLDVAGLCDEGIVTRIPLWSNAIKLKNLLVILGVNRR